MGSEYIFVDVTTSKQCLALEAKGKRQFLVNGSHSWQAKFFPVSTVEFCSCSENENILKQITQVFRGSSRR